MKFYNRPFFPLSLARSVQTAPSIGYIGNRKEKPRENKRRKREEIRGEKRGGGGGAGGLATGNKGEVGRSALAALCGGEKSKTEEKEDSGSLGCLLVLLIMVLHLLCFFWSN